jgi:hypothetical protein
VNERPTAKKGSVAMKIRTAKAGRLPVVSGQYNACTYTVLVNQAPVYSAGNHAQDSQVCVPASEGVGLRLMRRCCGKTAREIAEEIGGKFIGVEPAQPTDEM